MALINCKEPNCPGQVDTSLACAEVSSLFGLKVMMDHVLEAENLGEVLPGPQLQKQVDFINTKIQKFGIENVDEQINLFKKSLHQDALTPPLRISVLHLQCSKGHTYPYEVNCES